MKQNLLIQFLKGFNFFLHVMMAVALATASLMVLWEFCREVIVEIKQQEMALGFLHSLATLFLVWTLSSLISAEINYIQSGSIHLRIFVEVAMITLLRQLMIVPVKAVDESARGDAELDLWRYGLLLAAILILGVVHKLIGDITIQKKTIRIYQRWLRKIGQRLKWVPGAPRGASLLAVESTA